ncbi:hypothetical protein [Acidovorax sp.]|uniref:hypothetical protein n=1 Tax=Acidovorax sp. TaxID=1872122 RepID=UPI00391F7518
MNERRLNLRLAYALSVGAALVLLISALLLMRGGSAPKQQTQEALAAQCVKEFEAVGIKANMRPDDHSIFSRQGDLDALQDRVNALSVVMGRCTGYRLREFCAGVGCEKPGITFLLSISQ